MNSTEFYRENLPRLDAIKDCRWRQYRFLLQDQRFFKVPDVIRTAAGLQTWLIEKNPLDAYYTVSRFLNPRTLGPKTKQVSENMFLGSDLVFDIDQSPFTLEKMHRAQNTALRLLDWLETEGIKINYLAFSGSKGFHVSCKDPFNYPEENPIEREHAAKSKRIEITEELDEKNIEVDSKVTRDTRRILRVPGTINSKTGYECTIIDRTDLEAPFTEILNKCRQVMPSAFPIRKEMTDAFQAPRNVVGLHRWKARSTPSHYFSSQISSKVIGTSLHVPIIVFRTRSYKRAKLMLKAIQNRFAIADAYLFEGKELFALSLDALPFERVEKILSASDAANLRAFKKYGEAFVRISPKVSEKMQTLEDAPKLIETISSDRPPLYPVSRPHQSFLNECGIQTDTRAKFAGKSIFYLRHSLMEA